MMGKLSSNKALILEFREIVCSSNYTCRVEVYINIPWTSQDCVQYGVYVVKVYSQMFTNIVDCSIMWWFSIQGLLGQSTALPTVPSKTPCSSSPLPTAKMLAPALLCVLVDRLSTRHASSHNMTACTASLEYISNV